MLVMTANLRGVSVGPAKVNCLTGIVAPSPTNGTFAAAEIRPGTNRAPYPSNERLRARFSRTLPAEAGPRFVRKSATAVDAMFPAQLAFVSTAGFVAAFRM